MNKRASPSLTTWFCSEEAYEALCFDGYTRISDCPDVQAAVNYNADLISSMPIHLMENGASGDRRVFNELSRKIDVNPNSLTTRKTFMFNVARNMMFEGNMVCIPEYDENFYIKNLHPCEPNAISFLPNGKSYFAQYRGQPFAPEEILHFRLNPDPQNPWLGMGYKDALRDIADSLGQANKTKKGFMNSKWKPSLIVKVHGLSEDFQGKAGRSRLLDEYVSTSTAGEPWIIPSSLLDVEQVKPLSLNDLAITDTMLLDKKTVAGIVGVPLHVVGAGDFDEKEHRNFLNTSIKPKADEIQQELTRQLILRPDWYFKLSGRALYGYSIDALADVGTDLYARGLMQGNEVRNWLDLPPLDGLDELVILENYIPKNKIGDQKKLLEN